VIKAATLSDAAACSAILHAWIMETPWFPNHAPESATEKTMQDRIDAGTVLVANGASGTEGFVAFKNGYLDCLYLMPGARGKGLGKRLLDRAKCASPEGLMLWVLAQNEAAQRFYAREGFVETARGDGSDNEENLPDVCMEWKPMEAPNV